MSDMYGGCSTYSVQFKLRVLDQCQHSGHPPPWARPGDTRIVPHLHAISRREVERRQHYTQPVCSAVMSGQAGEDDIAGVNGPGKCNVHSILRRIYFRQRYMASCCRMTVSLLAPWPPQEVVQVNTRTVPNSTGAPSSPGTDI